MKNGDDGDELSEPLPREIYFVLNRPYCLWSSACASDNDDFIKSVNSKFYGRMSKQLSRRNLANDRTRAETGGIARIFWHHAIETFLTLVGATLQGPRATHSYFHMCRNDDLREIGRLIQLGERLPVELIKFNKPGWPGIFEAIFSLTPWHEDGMTAEFFTRFIKEAVGSFLSDLHRLEYNSLKHGMRVNVGASRLEIGPSKGEPDQAKKFVIGSKDSSHLLAIKPVPNVSKRAAKIHHQIERVTLGWSLERTIQDLDILAMAIDNQRSILRHILGEATNKLRFVRPGFNAQGKEEYFAQRPQLNNFVMRETFSLNEEFLETEAQIKKAFGVGVEERE